MQEGHRLEFEQKLDPTSPLHYKGIVFNEMKGALASGEARLGEYLMEALYPDITYGVNSGGDPTVIPNLTYEELIEFHKTFYHPGRCLFFFYGNLPLQQHLDFIENQILCHAQPAVPLSPIPPQPRFSQPKHVVRAYPLAEDPKDQTLIGFGWLTCSILDQLELLALVVLDLILMGTDAGPLKRALLESQLCKSADSAIDQDMSEVPYIVICKGCPEDAREQLQAVLHQTLEHILHHPLEQHLIDGAVHQIEMSRTEITGHSAPYGLSLFFRSALLKQHGGQAVDGLRMHTLFAQLREKLASPQFLSEIIRKHFLDNTHFVTVVLHPDQQLSQKEMDEERAILDKIQASLNQTTQETLVKQAQELEASQENDDHYDLLPTVTLQDVASCSKEYPLRSFAYPHTSIHCHPCFTNNHLYVDLVFDLPQIAPQDLSLLRLFVLLAPQLGCGGRTYKENLDYMLQHVGGAGLSLDLYPQTHDPQHLKPALSLRGRSLMRKADKLLPLLHDMLTTLDLTDHARIKELLMQHHYEMQMSLQTSSLRYAINLGASHLTLGGWVNEQWYGLHYFWYLQKIVTGWEKSPKALLDDLERIRTMCLGKGHSDFIMTCHEKDFDQLHRENFYGLLDYPQETSQPWACKPSIEPIASHGRLNSSPVAFTAFVLPVLAYVHPDTPALSLAAQIMDNTTLHKRIREQGGAYGSGATNSVQSGIFYCYAYRDPNLTSTIEAFKEAIDEICKGNFDEDDLEEAKLSLFQELDTPTPPGSRGISTFARLRGGRTPELRMQFRQQLRSITKEQVMQATASHLKACLEKATLVSFANAEFFEKDRPVFNQQPLPLYPI